MIVSASERSEPSLTTFLLFIVICVVLLSFLLANVLPKDDDGRSARAIVREAWAWLRLRVKPIYLLFALIVLVTCVQVALAHDSWISRGQHKNATTGEWCCGEGDCFALPAKAVHSTPRGYEISVATASAEGDITRLIEVIPYSEAQPSPDGQFWRCRRPDGTRRCFFAPRTIM